MGLKRIFGQKKQATCAKKKSDLRLFPQSSYAFQWNVDDISPVTFVEGVPDLLMQCTPGKTNQQTYSDLLSLHGGHPPFWFRQLLSRLVGLIKQPPDKSPLVSESCKKGGASGKW